MVLAIALGGLSYYLVSIWPSLFPPAVFHATAQEDCDLGRQACSALFEHGGRITLDIAPDRPVPMQPLRLWVGTAGLDGTSVKAQFRGVSMNMGQIDVMLREHKPKIYTGEVVLPVSIRDSMRWRSTIMVNSSAAMHQADFEFDIHRQ